MGLGLLRINLWGSLLLSLGRSLLQLGVLALGLSIALEMPGWGTIVFVPLLWMMTTQFTWNHLELPVKRPTLGLILGIAAGLPTLYTVLLVLRPTPLYLPQAWIPVLSLSLASASAIVLQGGNGIWQQFQRQKAEVQQPWEESLEEPFGERLKEDWDLEDLNENLTGLTGDPWRSEEKTETSLEKRVLFNSRGLTQGVLAQVLHLRLQPMMTLGLVSLPLVFAAQLLVNIDPLIALGYEVLLMLTTLNSALIALGGLQHLCKNLQQLNRT